MKKVLGVLFIFTIIFITGCSKQPSPDERFADYVNMWQKEDFSAMYEMLSTSTKESMSKDQFVKRYTDIYGDIEVSDLKVSFKKPTEEVKPKEGNIQFPFSVSMQTIAGPVEFTKKASLTEEKTDEGKSWFVNWDSTMIFPELHEGDQVGLTILKAKRGEIVDRNGQGLAKNGSAIEIGIVPEKLANNTAAKAKAAELLHMSVAEIDKALNASWVKPTLFVPIKRVSLNDQALITALMALPGFTKQEVPSRVYPFHEATAHLIGYIGSITKEELDKLKGKGYTSHDKIGKRGLEEVLEDRLKGENGARLYIKDKDVTLAEKPAVDGETVKLTIDVNVQKSLFEQLKGDAGTAAALDPKTGETLALVSSPAFDPNDFVLGLSSEEWKNLNDDPLNPLLNRFSKTYAPGSTFKPLTAAIALKNNVITPEKTKTIPSLKWQKDASWGNYFVKRVSNITSPINLQDALVYSDNIFFAQLALEIGSEKFTSGLESFGLNERVPYLYPVTASKISNDGLSKETLLADSGYGQGQIEMSILHLADAYTPFVSGGSLIRPILEYGEEQGKWHENIVPPDAAKEILADLVQVVESPHGTARDAKLSGITLAGKTGTAELKQKQGVEGTENGFFVAVNTDNPRLLIAMMIENVREKHGSHYVVPKVRNVFEEVLK